MDIRIYSNTGVYHRELQEAEHMVSSPLQSEGATRIETIAGKVVRFLLTSKGSDALDPSYGSYLTSYTQVSKSIIPRMHMDLVEDIAVCSRYIKEGEVGLPASEDRLASIALQSINYDPTTDRSAVHIYIRITTMAGETSLLSIPLRT